MSSITESRIADHPHTRGRVLARLKSSPGKDDEINSCHQKEEGDESQTYLKREHRFFEGYLWILFGDLFDLLNIVVEVGGEEKNGGYRKSEKDDKFLPEVFICWNNA